MAGYSAVYNEDREIKKERERSNTRSRSQMIYIYLVFHDLDLRVSVALTKHLVRFDVPLPASTESDLRKPGKAQLRADILTVRECGMNNRRLAHKEFTSTSSITLFWEFILLAIGFVKSTG